MTTRNSPLRINELSRITRTLFRQHHHGVGLFVLIATLFVLSFLAGLQPPMQFRAVSYTHLTLPTKSLV